MPQYGLSFHKSSALWPPPPGHLAARVHKRLRERVREAVPPKDKGASDAAEAAKPSVPPCDPSTHPGAPPQPSPPQTPDYTLSDPPSGRTLHLGAAQPLSALMSPGGVRSQRLEMAAAQGEKLAVEGQVHMYAPDYLLNHPLVSPAVLYLGKLLPLLVVARDKEVLRGEIIYLCVERCLLLLRGDGWLMGWGL